MNLYLSIAVIGIVSTLAMTLFLFLVHSMKIAKVDMLTAIGALFTQDLKKAFTLGLIFHLTAGVAFSFMYLSIASYFGFHTTLDFISFGAMIGFVHGTVVSILIVILVAEHHPMEQFRNSGFAVAASHTIAHLVYGIVLGSTAALMQPNLESMKIFGLGLS